MSISQDTKLRFFGRNPLSAYALGIINAICNSLRHINTGEEMVAVAAALTDSIKSGWMKARAVTRSRANPSICRLLGKRNESIKSPPATDHPEIFNGVDGRPKIFTSQPYNLSYECMKGIVDFCEANGLRADVLATSWHYYGRTLLIEYQKNES